MHWNLGIIGKRARSRRHDFGIQSADRKANSERNGQCRNDSKVLDKIVRAESEVVGNHERALRFDFGINLRFQVQPVLYCWRINICVNKTGSAKTNCDHHITRLPTRFFDDNKPERASGCADAALGRSNSAVEARNYFWKPGDRFWFEGKSKTNWNYDFRPD